MRTFLHRFYDLGSGGAEVVLLSFVRAFSEDRHVLVFNNVVPSWVSAELQSLQNVRGIQIKGRDIGALLAEHRPDVIFWHWYPPMSIEDMAHLPADVLSRSVLYNHWFTELPYLEQLREYWFCGLTSLAETGRRVPAEKVRILLNPVRMEVFSVRQQPEAARSVGRHSRPVGIKFSKDFFALYEGIAVPDLQVRILGCDPALVASAEHHVSKLRHTYWLLPSNSMATQRFLSFVRVYVYKTNDSFRETCPVSILEALAAGIPVVAENKGGIRDLIVPGQTGMLCDRLEDYHQAARMLLTDQDRWEEFSRKGREWAWENVSPAAYRRKCEELLGRGSAGALSSY
jgi:glycosyltransferase involved in cell wall biosynthesis